MLIDFRSDTVTLPSAGMLEAMRNAIVGDDVFGEDPTINLLEKTMAELFGMEASLYCTSGTMSNQIAIACHTRPGDEVICELEAHIYIYEGGGIAYHSGAQVRAIQGDRGRIRADQIPEFINPDEVYKSRTSLVCLENTSNRGGGSCYDLSEIVNIKAICNERNLKLHLDGARLFNALVARNENSKTYGELFDSISVCFNKGLGCPTGSILMGSKEFIYKARRIRKLFGGGTRQGGFMAATALYALENNIERLAIDHVHARQIAAELAGSSIVELVYPVETNLIYFELGENLASEHFVAEMKRNDILLLPVTKSKLRIITHLDINATMVDRFCTILKKYEA
jgi:threonine aldolase